MHNVCLLELLLFSLQLVLLVDELLPEDTLLIVQVQEDAQVLIELIVLLRLDDPLDLPLLRHFLFHLVHLVNVSMQVILQEALLLLPVILRFHVLLLPKLLLQQRLMMLIQFSRLPQGHLEAASRICGSTFAGGVCPSWPITSRSRSWPRLLEHLLLDALIGLVGWREISRVHFGFSIVVDDLLV